MPTFEVSPDIINTNKININIDENGLEWLSQPSNTGYVNAPPKLLERFYYSREFLKTKVISVKPKLDVQVLTTAIDMCFPNPSDKDAFSRKAQSGNKIVNLLKGIEPYGWKVKSRTDNEYSTSVYRPVAYINLGSDIGPFRPIIANSIYSFIIENLYAAEDVNNAATTFSNLSTPKGSVNRTRGTKNAAANTGNTRRAPLPASGPASVQSLPSSTQSIASVPSLPKRKTRKSRANRR